MNIIEISLGLGCCLGVLRFVLDDKWKALPNRLCRFCFFSWCAIVILLVPCAYAVAIGSDFLNIGEYIVTTALSIVITNISYVYLKNANL
jgi:heme exporter protein D